MIALRYTRSPPDPRSYDPFGNIALPSSDDVLAEKRMKVGHGCVLMGDAVIVVSGIVIVRRLSDASSNLLTYTPSRLLILLPSALFTTTDPETMPSSHGQQVRGISRFRLDSKAQSCHI